MVEEPLVEDVTRDVEAQRLHDGAALNVDLERFEREDVYRGEALVKAARSANGAAFRAALKAARRPIAGATPALRAASAPDGLARTHLSRWFDDESLRSPAGEVDKLTPVLYEAEGSARVALDALKAAWGVEAGRGDGGAGWAAAAKECPAFTADGRRAVGPAAQKVRRDKLGGPNAALWRAHERALNRWACVMLHGLHG